MTITDLVAKQNTFLCEFVDLKRNGFHHYTKALDALTGGFWGPVLRNADDAITKLADDMKLTIRGK
jgi:hypothetical protein